MHRAGIVQLDGVHQACGGHVPDELRGDGGVLGGHRAGDDDRPVLSGCLQLAVQPLGFLKRAEDFNIHHAYGLPAALQYDKPAVLGMLIAVLAGGTDRLQHGRTGPQGDGAAAVRTVPGGRRRAHHDGIFHDKAADLYLQICHFPFSSIFFPLRPGYDLFHDLALLLLAQQASALTPHQQRIEHETQQEADNPAVEGEYAEQRDKLPEQRQQNRQTPARIARTLKPFLYQ